MGPVNLRVRYLADAFTYLFFLAVFWIPNFITGLGL